MDVSTPAPDSYGALRALLAASGATLVIDAMPAAVEGSAVGPTVVVCTGTGLDAGTLGRLDLALEAGATVAVAFGPRAASLADELTARRSTAGPTASPIVAPTLSGTASARTVSALGAGRVAGLTLSIPDALSFAIGHPLASSNFGSPIVELSGPGRLVLIGSATWLRDDCVASGSAGRALLRLLDLGDPRVDLDAWRENLGRHSHPRVVDLGCPLTCFDPPVPFGDPGFVPSAARAGRLLPAAVFDALAEFQDTPPPSAALVIRGLPTGVVPPTPSSPTAASGKDSVSEFVLMTVARRLGQPVGYAPEHSGDLVQSILPIPEARGRQVSTSSDVRLMWHTEAAFHPHRPRYLLLFCLRSDPAGSGATLLASVSELARRLPLSTRKLLAEPRFATGVDESYTGRRATRVGDPHPIISGPPGDEIFLYDEDLTVGLDPAADGALKDLAAAIDEHHIAVTLRAGDLLVVDNYRAVHGRGPFSPRFDGSDRWLQRSFVVCDLAPSAPDRWGRIIETRFVA